MKLDFNYHKLENTKIERILQKARQSKIASSFSVGYFVENKLFETCSGNLDPANTDRKTDYSTMYDLASLTKALATSLFAFHLKKSGLLNLNHNLNLYSDKLFKNCNSEFGKISIRQLLNHTSGLPAYLPLYKKTNHPQKAFEIITKLEPDPSKKFVYSDPGFIILGQLFNFLSGKSWSNSICQYFYHLLSSRDKIDFFPLKNTDNLASNSEPRKKHSSGMVHDENCQLLGPDSAHAGLFASLRGVGTILRALCLYYNRENSDLPNFLDHRTVKELFPKGCANHHVNGWDKPSPKGYSSTGKFWPANLAFGHLGFTGTACWFVPQWNFGAVFLTNRVAMGRRKKMKELKKLRSEIFTELIKIYRFEQKL
ncbi:MAG: serine hydrolase domain-containing protein [Myxococcota bacterium]